MTDLADKFVAKYQYNVKEEAYLERLLNIQQNITGSVAH